MMATMMRARIMMMMKTTTRMALKMTSRMGAAQANGARRARMHQQASFLRLLCHSLFSSIYNLRQDPSLALGNPAQSKVQLPQNLCCPDIKANIWDLLREAS